MGKRPPKQDISNLAGKRLGAYLRVSRADKCKQCKGSRRDAGGPCAACNGTGIDLDDTGQERSTGTQRRIYKEWAERSGVVVAGEYADPDISASRFAVKKNRPQFERMVDDIKAGKLDILWFWEISRQQRRLDVFAGLRDLCRDKGVLWVIRDRVADPANSQDMLLSGIQTILAEDESEKLSVRVTDGKESAAHKGRPPGRVPYGYKRIWDAGTGEWERDIPNVFDADGRPVEDSPAHVVREIFERIAKGEAISAIRRDLNRRGLRTQHGYQWDNSKVRYIALSPTYIGKRVYHVEDHTSDRAGAGRVRAVLDGVKAQWEPLVTEDLFWEVHSILTSPLLPEGHPWEGRERTTTRRGWRTERHLLAFLARCAECGGKLVWKISSAASYSHSYGCEDHGCVGIPAAELDGYVEKVIVRYLSHPRVARALTEGEKDPAAAAQAKADARRYQQELEQLYRDSDAGLVSPRIATGSERRLKEAIAEAERRREAAALPSILEGRIGPQAEAGWRDLDVAGKRLVIQTVAEIRVHRVGKGRFPGGTHVPPAYRVSWRPLVPAPGEWIPPLDYEAVRAEARQRLAARKAQGYISAELRERIAKVLKGDPMLPDKAAMRQAGCNYAMAVKIVRRDLEDAGEIPVIRRRGREKPVNHGYQPRSAT